MQFSSSAGVRGALLGVLMAASLVATAAGPKTGGTARTAVALQSPGTPEPPTRLIVRYKSGVKMAGQGGVTPATERHEAAMRVARTAHLAGVAELRYLKSVSPTLHVVLLPDALTVEEARAAMQRLRQDDGVADVTVDHRVKPHLVPNDPRFTDGAQWHLQNSGSVPGGLNAPAAWDFSTGAGVVVAVLDGGYRPHADLVDNILPGYDFVSADGSRLPPFWTANDGNGRDADARDPGDWVTQADVDAGYCSTVDERSSWHGTHVAGIVAARGDNSRDGLGVAYGARILPVRVLGRCGGYVSDILAGAGWAAGLTVPGVPANPHPARILNLSLGVDGRVCDSNAQTVVNQIRALNVSIVASAGNAGRTQISMPANCSGVIAVTAHTREGDNADYANVGAGVAISAPGGGDNTTPSFPTQPGIRGIWSTWNTGLTVPGNDDFWWLQGTSMAAPQVAGVLALLASLRPNSRMESLEQIVINAARPFPAGSYCANNPGFCGSGLLDAAAAVEAARPDSPDLSVTQSLVSGTPVLGALSQYSITVRNVGGVTATGVQVVAALSAGMQFVTSTTVLSDAVLQSSENGLTVTLGSLAPGQAVSITVSVNITDLAGTLTSTASASTELLEFSAANNQSLLVLYSPPAQVTPAAGGGGGCTVAPDGQADAGLALLVLVAGMSLLWRRRAQRVAHSAV